MILDTNALSAWAEGSATVEACLRFAERLVVPSIVLGEYYFGIRQSRCWLCDAGVQLRYNYFV